MPASEANKLVDEIVRMGLHPTLKSAGYTKQSRTFYRGDDPVQVVNVQGSHGNTADNAKITINLGLFFPKVRLVLPEPPLNERPKEYNCTMRMRIGELIPPQNDKWWTITPTSDIAAISSEIVDAWNRYGAEWMERCSELAAARQEAVTRGDRVLPVAISLALGERDMARQYFDMLMQTCTPHSRRYFQGWGKKHGLGHRKEG